MAGFKTHITTSSLLGIGYGATGYLALDMPVPECLLATGLCGVSGMLPDLDSDSGRPLRESIAFAAAVVPMFMVHRFEHMGMSAEAMVLVGAAIYLFIRFGVSQLLKWYTVHRGMFHSLPAALIAAEVAFLLSTSDDLPGRYYKAGAVLAGFMSHLILDELWSIEWKGGRWRLKRSFGTALKLWSTNKIWPNVSTYAKLAILSYLAFRDPTWMQDWAARAYHGHPVGEHSHQHQEQDQFAGFFNTVTSALDSTVGGSHEEHIHDHGDGPAERVAGDLSEEPMR